jgi:hypothetical protein
VSPVGQESQRREKRQLSINKVTLNVAIPTLDWVAEERFQSARSGGGMSFKLQGSAGRQSHRLGMTRIKTPTRRTDDILSRQCLMAIFLMRVS